MNNHLIARFPSTLVVLAASIATVLIVLVCPTSAQALESVPSENAWSNCYFIWASPMKSFLTIAPSGNLQRVEYMDETGLVVEEYTDDYRLVSSETIEPGTYTPSMLGSKNSVVWGGYFAGKQYNFVVTGQNNYDESATLPTIRVSKYTKDWSFVSYFEKSDINTTAPFEAGSLRMAEKGGQLWVRTCHQMNTSDDGLRHQANMTFVINESDMSFSDGSWKVVISPFAYVSHSFNQFITTLGSDMYAVDHGDAYPRSVCLNKLGSYGTEATLLSFSGTIGENNTYASVGGFESSTTQNTLLTVGNSADQSLFSDEYLARSLARNVWLTVTTADLLDTKMINLTSFAPNGDIQATTPTLVKVNDDKFMIAWGEYKNSYSPTLKYLFIDGRGSIIEPVEEAAGMLSDCQPIVIDGKVCWYSTGENTTMTGWGPRVSKASAPTLYSIDTSTYEFKSSRDLEYAQVSLSESSVGYAGKAINPTVVVTHSGKTLIEGTDYTVEYKNNVNVGTAKATVTGMGLYTGSRSLDFTITAAPLTASYTGESVILGGTPLLTVNVTGFVNNESAATAAGYVAPTVTAPSSQTVGTTSLTPAGGQAKNYTFNYTSGNLVVLKEAAIKRLAGEASPDTAAAISAEAFPGGSDWVVLARSDDFADAMSATGLAGTLKAPIVLTDRYGLSPAASNEIKRLGATKCYIIGGTGAMPGDFEGQLAALGMTQVERVNGTESWDTSVACANKINAHGGNADKHAIVAMSSNFQDALSISSFAYAYGVPIFLEASDDFGRALPGEAVSAIKGLSGTIYVAGGTGAVPASTLEGVFGAGKVVRLFGNDGYDTSNQVATYMASEGLLSAGTVCVACGTQAAKGSDALAGASLAGKNGGVILLANSNTKMESERLVTIEGNDSQGTPSFLTANAASVANVNILGGTYVVPESLENKVRSIL